MKRIDQLSRSRFVPKVLRPDPLFHEATRILEQSAEIIGKINQVRAEGAFPKLTQNLLAKRRMRLSSTAVSDPAAVARLLENDLALARALQVDEVIGQAAPGAVQAMIAAGFKPSPATWPALRETLRVRARALPDFGRLELLLDAIDPDHLGEAWGALAAELGDLLEPEPATRGSGFSTCGQPAGRGRRC